MKVICIERQKHPRDTQEAFVPQVSPMDKTKSWIGKNNKGSSQSIAPIYPDVPFMMNLSPYICS